MKKKIAMLLIAAMTVGLVACGGNGSDNSDSSSAADANSASGSSTTSESTADSTSTDSASESDETAVTNGDTPKIAFVGKVTAQPWWEHVKESVEAWGAENNVEVTYQAPTEIDAAAQVQIMTDLVNQGEIDALLFSPNDPAACEAICQTAREKGIIVIATEASGMENVDYDIEAFDEAGIGALLMDELAAQMGEEGEYVTMVGSLTMESQNNWADQAIAHQEEAYPNMTYLDERVVNDSDADLAYSKTKELIQKYPNLKGILGTGSFDAPGAARAIEEMGLTGQVFAISGAMPSEIADYIKNGTLQSVGFWDAGVTAEAMCELAVQMYQGAEIGDTVDLGVEGYTECVVDGTLVTGDGQITINADNIDEWLATGI